MTPSDWSEPVSRLFVEAWLPCSSARRSCLQKRQIFAFALITSAQRGHSRSSGNSWVLVKAAVRSVPESDDPPPKSFPQKRQTFARTLISSAHRGHSRFSESIGVPRETNVAAELEARTESIALCQTGGGQRSCANCARGRLPCNNPVVSDCPFCKLSGIELLLEHEHAFAFFDAFPVTEGHVLIVPKRHVATWFEATREEQHALLDLVDQAKALLDAEHHPDGYNLGINVGEAAGQTVPHLHLHLIPRRTGDVDDPRGGVRFVIPEEGNYKRPGFIPRKPSGSRAAPLSVGGRADPFLAQLRPLFARAQKVRVLAAFVQSSGVEQLRAILTAALARGARVQLLTGDYLHLTQARALRSLLDLQEGEQLRDDEGDEPDEDPETSGTLKVRVVEASRLRGRGSTFHPKSWIFEGAGFAAAFVGSSNLSHAALTDGVEWNLRVERSRDAEAFDRVVEAFEQTWGWGTALSAEWLEGYAERAAMVQRELPAWDVEEGAFEAPEPRDVQREALAELRRARTEQDRDRALVVLATGLGKTWLAAFDVQQLAEELGRTPRVLFLAHRKELLRQAAQTFRRLFPDQRFGWFVGQSDDLQGDVVFASVMKLGRQAQQDEERVTPHLDKIGAQDFDYVVVDEVHHADADTYRRVLGRLEPAFRLGLTATPERADAGDVLGLFDDFVAYEAGIGEGIAGKHLVPFHYFGIKDVVDYAPIPWRNRRFDPAKLAKEVQTEARMARLWEAWEERPGTRTLVFCCSIAHADFVKRWLGGRGLSVRAAHTGPQADDRAEALEALASGEVQAVCTVDLFNEGIDLPAIDRVVMLRPTESPVIFLQQLGRGLRTSEGKDALTVIDFVGNHRVFLERVRTLLELAGKDAPSLREFVKDPGPVVLPDGCKVDVELEAKELMQQLLPAGSKHVLIAAFRELRSERDRRPTLTELHRMGCNPNAQAFRKAYESWFAFVEDEGALSEAERTVLAELRPFLAALEREERMTKCFKMVLLEALLETGKLWEGMELADLAQRSLAILRRSPELVEDFPAKLGAPRDAPVDAWQAYWRENPVRAWIGDSRDKAKRAWFRLEGERFVPRFGVPAELRDTAEAMIREVVDYRLARYRRERAARSDSASFTCKLITNKRDPILKLPSRKKHARLPEEETPVTLPDGSQWSFRFKKEFCNVARPVGESRNQLPDLLRWWFGLAAGQPGTDHRVRFGKSAEGYTIEPLLAEGGEVTPREGRLIGFPSLRAAAGWSPTGAVVAESLEPVDVALPGDFDRYQTFAVRASGDSMTSVRAGIRDGDWLVLRWARSATLGEVLGRVALIARGDPDAGQTFHLKRVERSDDGLLLCSDNPAFPPVPVEEGDQVIALLVEAIPPERLAPQPGALVDDVAEAFGISQPPGLGMSRVDGHLFLVVRAGAGVEAELDAVVDAQPAETAFVLQEADGERLRYLGLARQGEGGWRLGA